MRTRARALAASLEYTSPAGPAPSHRTHSILRARAHPSAVGIGRADPARRGETPKRLRRLPIPTAVKTSLPSLSQRSGVEAAAAAAAAALPEVAAPLSAGRWRVRPAAVARLRSLSGRARLGLGDRPARRPVPFVWLRAGVCITFRTPPSPFRLSVSLSFTLLPTPAAIPQRTAGLLD